MIVEQAVAELGGWERPDIDRLLDLWQELSGVDVRQIDENTPFDPTIVDKLLATSPKSWRRPRGPRRRRSPRPRSRLPRR